MSLDTKNRSRDYLYGRLIAQAESMEWYALYLQNFIKILNSQIFLCCFCDIQLIIPAPWLHLPQA